MPSEHSTHERFLHQARQVVIAHAVTQGTIDDEQAKRAIHAKLLYGVGDGRFRGMCYYSAWQNGIGQVDVVEIMAAAQESWIQLAGTVVHELGHVVAGFGTGHGREWKEAAVKLGFLIRPAAAGQVYNLAMFAPALRHAIYRLAGEIGDGQPAFRQFGPVGTVTPRPCSVGVGTKGGTSRGKGSGSRLRLWECECQPPVKVRVSSNSFAAHCDECGAAFHRV